MADTNHRAEEITRRPDKFAQVAHPLARFTGSPWAAALVAVIVVAWLLVGSAVDYSKPWELAATAGVPILTLGLVIVLQRSQNHDSQAVQLKLDELIRALEGSSNAMMRVEEAGTDELDELQEEFQGDADNSSPGKERDKEGGKKGDKKGVRKGDKERDEARDQDEEQPAEQ